MSNVTIKTLHFATEAPKQGTTLQYIVMKPGEKPVMIDSYRDYLIMANECGHKMGPSNVRVTQRPPTILGSVKSIGGDRQRCIYLTSQGRSFVTFKNSRPYHWSFWKTSIDQLDNSGSLDPADMARHGVFHRHEVVLTRNFGFAIYDAAAGRRVSWTRDYPNSIEITDYSSTPMMIGVSRDVTDAWMDVDSEFYIHKPEQTEAILRWYDEVCRHCPRKYIAEARQQFYPYAGLTEIDVRRLDLMTESPKLTIDQPLAWASNEK